MLGKLIKYEWKDTCKMGFLVLAVIACMTLLGVVGGVFPINFLVKNAQGITDGNALSNILMGFTVMTTYMVYIIGLIGGVYGVLIYSGVHFYKTMYSDQGYLTHTLPVTSGQLLISKMFISGVWYMLVLLGISISIMTLSGFLINVLLPEGFWESVAEIFRGLLWDNSEGYAEVRMVFVQLIFFWLFNLLIMPFATMMILYGSLTIGQLFRKYRAVMGILVYFGITFLSGIFGSVASQIVTTMQMLASDMAEDYTAVFMYGFGGYYIQFFVTVGVAVGLFFVSNHILQKKLNLE